MQNLFPLFLISAVLIGTSACKAPIDAPPPPPPPPPPPIQGEDEPSSVSASRVVDYDFSCQKYITRNAPIEYYPIDALKKKIEGSVHIYVEINSEGTLITTKVIAGPKIFRNAAVNYLHSQRFEPAATKNTDSKSLRFAIFLISFKLPNAQSHLSPDRPNHAFNPDPAATIHHALSCPCFPVSVPRPACGWAG